MKDGLNAGHVTHTLFWKRCTYVFLRTYTHEQNLRHLHPTKICTHKYSLCEFRTNWHGICSICNSRESLYTHDRCQHRQAEALEDYGVTGRAIQSLYENGWARVRVRRSDSS